MHLLRRHVGTSTRRHSEFLIATSRITALLVPEIIIESDLVLRYRPLCRPYGAFILVLCLLVSGCVAPLGLNAFVTSTHRHIDTSTLCISSCLTAFLLLPLNPRAEKPSQKICILPNFVFKQNKMKTPGNTVQEILMNVPQDRLEPFNKLHEVIMKNLPKGFEPAISYGGLGYVVPHTIYPAGYHCKPSEPVPFAGIASQKGSINFYHMGIYAVPALLAWFQQEYPKHTKHKLDMGKSCVRFKKMDDIPYKLIGELMKKMTVKDWLAVYEKHLTPKSKSK